ncbi:MAG: hypothetical protein KC503_14230 [Myxococcales bacterium]|nr:hypothetical protein [Myxococcales bacterium]
MSDFPAAHSMDTEWFAVDGDGRVAMLDSGEAGNVSDSYLSYRGGRDEEMWGDYFGRALAETRDEPMAAQVDDLAALERRGQTFAIGWEGNAERHDLGTLRERDWPADLMLILREPLVLLEAELDGGGRLRGARGEELFYWREIAAEPAADLTERARASGALRCAFFGDDMLTPPRLGLYQYDCDVYGDDPPYAREARPLLDLRITDLPLALREPALQTRMLRARFDALLRMRVTKYVTCSGWGADEVGPLPQRAPRDRIITLGADGSALLLEALREEGAADGQRGARAVLADWLQDRQHPLGELLLGEQPLFPAALDMLSLPAQLRLGCELVQQVVGHLAGVDDELSESASDALDIMRRFASGVLPADSIASEAEQLLLFSAWLGLLSPHPWARDVADEASWMHAFARAAALGGWDRAREQARREQIALAVELLRDEREI